jgi:hypothetical protein
VDWIERCVVGLIALMVAGFVFMCVAACDWCLSSTRLVSATVIDATEDYAAYTTHGMVLVGKVPVPQTYYHPARRVGFATVDGHQYHADVSKSLNGGDECNVVETVGILFHHGYSIIPAGVAHGKDSLPKDR